MKTTVIAALIGFGIIVALLQMPITHKNGTTRDAESFTVKTNDVLGIRLGMLLADCHRLKGKNFSDECSVDKLVESEVDCYEAFPYDDRHRPAFAGYPVGSIWLQFYHGKLIRAGYSGIDLDTSLEGKAVLDAMKSKYGAADEEWTNGARWANLISCMEWSFRGDEGNVQGEVDVYLKEDDDALYHEREEAKKAKVNADL